MKLKNVLIVVKDIEKSKQFYHDLFGLNVVLDNDGNMILTEGLVLQEEKIWRNFLGKEIVSESNACELYFEERDIEAFVQKLEKLYPSVQYVNRLMTDSWGQKVVRFYDLDGNLIEVGTPVEPGPVPTHTIQKTSKEALHADKRYRYLQTELFYIQQGIYRQLWKYALSTYPKKRRGRGSSSVGSSLSTAILLGGDRRRKKTDTGIPVYGRGKK